ncbi:MAG: nucleotidyltransferase domain-containing protein, partial [Gemmatimonadetes bacterium]|nr:nucleotidyltransferase domain-containing protein [Gemmatimonadota bacterium]
MGEMITVAAGLNHLVQTLRARCPDEVRAVWLYGSRARGDARPDSDVDVLVVL